MGCSSSKDAVLDPPGQTGHPVHRHPPATKAKKGGGGGGGGGGFYDNFKLEKVLGTGAFSTVKEASEKGSGEHYAVKCVTRADLPTEDEAALKMEVKILRELDHPNVVKVVGFYEEKRYFFVVMELLKGGELFDRIVQKTYYNEFEAREVVRVLLEAVAYLHGRGVVHRDLKPENLLMVSKQDDANIKVADFGFAVHEKEGGGLRTQCGTPGYVAPEILKGEPYGHAVDMWSIGVIVYILLGGYPPFNDDNQAKLYKKIKHGRFTFHAEYWGLISDDAKDLIKRMLTVDPAKRIEATQALRHPWMLKDGGGLAANDLGVNLGQFKLFNARRKLRSAIHSVVATNRLSTLFEPDNGEGKDGSGAPRA